MGACSGAKVVRIIVDKHNYLPKPRVTAQKQVIQDKNYEETGLQY